MSLDDLSLTGLGTWLYLPAIYFLGVAFSPPQSAPSKKEKQFEKDSVYGKAEKLQIGISIIKWALTSAFLLEILLTAVPGLRSYFKSSEDVQIGGASAQLVQTSLILIILGGLIRGWCYRSLGSFFTWEIAIRSEHKLITTGPYSFVRHPSYVGIWLTILGTVIYLNSSETWLHWTVLRPSGIIGSGCRLVYNLWSLLWFSVIAFRATQEDRIMAKNFGQEWIEWSSRVKWFFIPGIY